MTHRGLEAKRKPLREGGVSDWIELCLPAITTAITTAAAATTTGALFRLSDVHSDGASVEFGPVEGLDGLVGRLVVNKCDEAKPSGTTRVAIADHNRLRDLAERAERLVEAFVLRVPAQTSNKQFLSHISSHLPGRCSSNARPFRKSLWTFRPPVQKPAPVADYGKETLPIIFFHFKRFISSSTKLLFDRTATRPECWY